MSLQLRLLQMSAAVLTVLGASTAAQAQPPSDTPGAAHRPVIIGPGRHDITRPLRELPVLPPQARAEEPHAPLPVRGGPAAGPRRPDPKLQISTPTINAITPLVSFEGIGNTAGVLPPDTNGDVGPSHYVQWVNLSFAIYNKTGGLVFGPADGRTLWQGFGGPCETQNDGDPIVLYDEMADRWLMSQFALPNYPQGPFYQCIAVSATGDPTGSYHRYAYSFSKLNDYPKFGVWSDGYYMSMNQFTCTILGCRWAGEGVVAFDRAQMLSGGAARAVYFDMASDASLGGMLPADTDGAPAPPGSPNYFLQFDDEPDQLQLWEFKTDWANPAGSTFTRKAALPTASFDSNLCGGSRNCIAQPGTTAKIDAIGDRLMYRLQYRNFGTYESLVTNHTVDVSGTDHAGVRWYEIRNPHTAPVIHQQGTYAPADTLHRWMGSAAMDKSGNLALGYSVANGQTFPSIRFTGRLATDPPDTLTISESDIQAGTGSQTHSSGRWGDYSMLAVDPTDGCTFWYTTEYYLGSSTAGWKTNIGSFTVGACGGPPPPPPVPPAAPSDLTATASAGQIALGWTDSSTDETGFRIERCQGAGCSNFTLLTTSAANATAYLDASVAAGTSYSYRAFAVNAAGSSAASNTATATTPPAPTGTVHVGSMSGSSAVTGKSGWRATVTIAVRSAANAPVANAVVSGNWSAGFSGGASCTTGTSGTCSVTTPKLAMNVGAVTFTVGTIAHAPDSYDPAANTPKPPAVTVSQK